MGDNSQGLLPGARDTGLPIERVSFRLLVGDYLARMQSGDDMTPADYVMLTRLWNTIEVLRLAQDDPLYQKYAAAFFPDYVERVSQALGALPTKGMALYAKDYDLFLGGKPHANSQFSLIVD